MAWAEISTAPPLLTLGSNGQVSWNNALQILLGDPKWVDLMWDNNTSRLGIRQSNVPDGLPVIAEPEGLEWKIASTNALTAAGISVPNNVEATPEQWVQSNAEAGWAEWFGYPTIYYITIA